MASRAAEGNFEEQRERVDDPMRRLLIEYGSENAYELAVGLVSSVVARLLDLVPPLLLGVAIDVVFLSGKTGTVALLPWGLLEGTRGELFAFTVGAIALSFAGSAAFHWLRNWGFNSFAQNVQHAVRTDTYDQMQRLKMEFFDERQTGEMMSVLSNDVNRLETFLNEGFNSASRLSVLVLGIAAILFYLNWQLALISLVTVPVIAVFTHRFVQTIQPKYARMRSTVGALNSRLENNLGGIEVIKTSTAEEFESERVEDASLDYYEANWDAISTRIKFFPGLRVMAGLGFTLTFVVGGLWVFTGEGPWILSGSLSVGSFVVFILYTQRFVWPLSQFGQIINMYQRAKASSARIFGLMQEPSRIREDPNAGDLVVKDGGIEFRDVTFGYGGAEPLFDGLSLDVEPGETLALVGPTGSGKTTLLRLLLRLYDVDSGAVLVDGTDVRDVTVRSLRRAIGYVSQDTFLFHGTVDENVRYGRFDASTEEVTGAARAAAAHEFVRELPDGYDTLVGERGVKLSGGQRQRIALARALLKDPAIYVLDEATSEVDPGTERRIHKSLEEITGDRTTFLISHRLQAIRDADRIVVLREGEIAEQGTHEELVELGGLYAELWEAGGETHLGRVRIE